MLTVLLTSFRSFVTGRRSKPDITYNKKHSLSERQAVFLLLFVFFYCIDYIVDDKLAFAVKAAYLFGNNIIRDISVRAEEQVIGRGLQCGA